MPVDTVTIRPAHPSESELLTRLAHAAKAHWGYPAHWVAAWTEDLTFTPAFIRQHTVCVACSGDQVVGVYALEADKETLHLAHLWVDPSYMKQGIGRALMEHALASARQADFSTLEIWSDPHAEAFYQRMGATRVGSIPAGMDTAPDRVLPKLVVPLAL